MAQLVNIRLLPLTVLCTVDLGAQGARIKSWVPPTPHEYINCITELPNGKGFITSDKISAEMVMHDPNNLTKAYGRIGKFANSSLRAVGPTSAVKCITVEELSAGRLRIC